MKRIPAIDCKIVRYREKHIQWLILLMNKVDNRIIKKKGKIIYNRIIAEKYQYNYPYNMKLIPEFAFILGKFELSRNTGLRRDFGGFICVTRSNPSLG